MNVISSKIGFGSIGLDGALGFSDGMTADKVMVRHPHDWSISAHASSEIQIEIDEPAAICGAMNASATFDNSCEFWINDHWIGDLMFSCQTTPEIHLHPGKYRLTCSAGKNHHGVHSVWLGRKSDWKCGKIALLIIAGWQRSQIKMMAKVMPSAARMGWLCEVFGIDERFQGLYEEKIVKMVDRIKRLPSHYTHVLYLDARDVLLTATEADFAANINDGITIGMEACVWPEVTEEWASGVIAAVRKNEPLATMETSFGEPHFWANAKGIPANLYLNSGMFIGERNALIDHLTCLREFRSTFSTGPDWLKNAGRSNNPDDQFVWQAYYRLKAGRVKLDLTNEFFLNMPCETLDLASPLMDVTDGLVVKRFGTRPMALHFCGWALDRFDRWSNWILG